MPLLGGRAARGGLVDQIRRPADEKGDALLHIASDPGIAARPQQIGCTFLPGAVVERPVRGLAWARHHGRQMQRRGASVDRSPQRLEVEDTFQLLQPERERLLRICSRCSNARSCTQRLVVVLDGGRPGLTPGPSRDRPRPFGGWARPCDRSRQGKIAAIAVMPP